MQDAKTVRDFVIDDYRTADVFRKWGINYCCGGNLPLEEACTVKQISLPDVKYDLSEATRNIVLSNTTAFHEWPVPFLTDYIVYVHHSYLKTALPQLRKLLASFVPGHLKKYPHLADVQHSFADLADELEEHLKEEEESIFPYVKQINSTYSQKESYGGLFVRTLRKPLGQTIEKEHGRIASLLKQLRKLTNHYSFGPDACPNYRVIYHKLKELDADLVQHKHLENNILFPKALEMEKSLLQL